jgi:hypothetical protein
MMRLHILFLRIAECTGLGEGGSESSPSAVFADTVQAELDQMIRFKLSAGPAIPLLELNSEEIVCFGKSAVLDARLTGVFLEMKSDDASRRNKFLDFDTCARW